MKTNRIIRLLSALLILVMLAASLANLTSCDSYGGSASTLTQSELLLNVEAGENMGFEYASDYLDKWDFPRFSLKKLRALENVFESKFVNEIGDPYERAKLTAKAFIDSYYSSTDLSDITATTDALIHAYVSTIGDRYSIYRTAEEYREYSSDMSGSFVGIGVTVRYSLDGSEIRIERVHAGSGAEAAGILAGDKIILVDGVSVDTLGYEKTVSSIRGEENTVVKIGVLRDGNELSFDVTRKLVVEDSVTYTIEGGIAYITITSFKDNSYSQFKKAIDAALEANVRGIVYDLRGNPGGYLSAVTDMLSYICPKGTPIASFTNDYAKPTISKNEHEVRLPTVVICDGNTASAGELFTAAIRDFSKMGLFEARIVGERTFGKGIMQNTYMFSDGSSITLTVAYYNPPLGENYHGFGIEPDNSVPMGDEGDAQMDAARLEIKALLEK